MFQNTFLTPVNYNPTLEITDGSGIVATELKLGASAQLRFRMTIEDYSRKLLVLCFDKRIRNLHDDYDDDDDDDDDDKNNHNCAGGGGDDDDYDDDDDDDDCDDD